jgi:hypothetical protein
MAVDEDGNVVPSIVEDQDVNVEMLQLLAIWQSLECERGTIYPSSIWVDEFTFATDEPSVRVNAVFLTETLNEMYTTIDSVCDAVTTADISRVLRIVITLLAACGGWFFGAIAGQRAIEHIIYC